MTNESQANARPAAPTWKRYWPAGLAICLWTGIFLDGIFRASSVGIPGYRKGVSRRSRRSCDGHQERFRNANLPCWNRCRRLSTACHRSIAANSTNSSRRSNDHACSIVAVEWVPRVADSRRQEYENAARRDGIEGFQFTELDSNGQIVPAAERERIFSDLLYRTGAGQSRRFRIRSRLGADAARSGSQSSRYRQNPGQRPHHLHPGPKGPKRISDPLARL